MPGLTAGRYARVPFGAAGAGPVMTGIRRNLRATILYQQ